MKCERCGATDRPIEKHHIKARINGGGDETGNLTGICYPCHKYKSARLSLELQIARYERGLVGDKKGRWRTLEVAKEYYQKQLEKYQWRINKLDELNTPGKILARGKHESYYPYEESSWGK